MLEHPPAPARRRFDDPPDSRAWRRRASPRLGPRGTFQLSAGCLCALSAFHLGHHLLFPIGPLLALPIGFLLGSLLPYTLPWLALAAVVIGLLRP